MMGTLISLSLFEKNDIVVNSIYKYLAISEKLFSANRNDSEISKINQQAGKHPVQVNSNVFQLIKKALIFSKLYPESFNIAVGPLVKLWQIGFSGQHLPNDDEIKKCLCLVDTTGIELDDVKDEVFLKYPGMELDLGAIAKGYFADQIHLILKKYSINNAIIDLGGNVLTLGSNQITMDHKWQIGIQDPRSKRGNILGSVACRACSAVTSGVSERYFIKKGHLYHHIINPKTGYPLENNVSQVTIFSSSSLEGEVISTVAFFAGVVNGIRLINKMKNVEAIYVTRTGQIVTTAGLRFRNFQTR